MEPWTKWPEPVQVEIGWLPDGPCFDRSSGFCREDNRWKDGILRRFSSGKLMSPLEPVPCPEFRQSLNAMMFRVHHAARAVQVRFGNPNQGNYRDPFLETLFIMLTWRTKIEYGRKVLEEIMTNFETPRQLVEPESLQELKSIIGRAGFSGKRPQMLINVVERFIEKFPDGDTSAMSTWEDDDLIDFLDSMDGVGRKSALCIMMYSLGRNVFPIDAHVGRVLSRTQMLRELYVVPDDIEHRELQRGAEFAVPPSVRLALHAGLISLGKEVCRKKPRCNACPINKVCEYYSRVSRTDAEGKSFTHVDLFSGAGGFSAGFSAQGFRTVLAADSDQDAHQTFRLNHPEVPEGNIQKVDLSLRSPQDIIASCGGWAEDLVPGKVDVLTAGIPCQGFSKAGYRSRPKKGYNPYDDPRNYLYLPVIKWADYLKPKYVVIENVPEIKSAGSDKSKILDAICRAFGAIGYKTSYGIVDANDYGVPQTRRRLILIASNPSVQKIGVDQLEKFAIDGGNLGPAIEDLPSVEAGKGSWYQFIDGKVVTGHVARYNNKEDLRIFGAFKPGEHYKRFIEREPDILEDRKRNRLHAVYGTKSFSDKYHRLEPDKPSRTIVSHLERDGNGYIHPEQVRSITLRETMRLQGFDDSFVFCGSRGAQFVQVGNAIPPPLAGAVAKLLKEGLGKTDD